MWEVVVAVFLLLLLVYYYAKNEKFTPARYPLGSYDPNLYPKDILRGT